MRWRMGIVGCVCVVVCWGGVLGCRTGPPAAASAERSVCPGINEPYLGEGLDVREWVKRLERPEREVYAQRERIIHEARLRPGSSVADIGAGTGPFSLLMADAVGSEGRVYAVEIVPEFLLHIRQRAAQAGVTNMAFVLGTERSVSLAKESIDLALVVDTYHHFEYPQSTLASIGQALRAGGELVVVDFKRIPGRSSDWVLSHVRLSQEQAAAEIERAGFRKVQELNFLKQNYFMRFRKAE